MALVRPKLRHYHTSISGALRGIKWPFWGMGPALFPRPRPQPRVKLRPKMEHCGFCRSRNKDRLNSGHAVQLGAHGAAWDVRLGARCPARGTLPSLGRMVRLGARGAAFWAAVSLAHGALGFVVEA